ncbi:MAG: hypothetical protein K1X78_10705 [Verrucomicrobiaceae bacterium]|nr:hypothetical protein [Verrucomicrobiaceae bacterium]
MADHKQEFKGAIRAKLQSLERDVEKGVYRCAFGFLSALNSTMNARAVGLLLKLPGQIAKPRYHVGGTLEAEQLSELTQKIDKLMTNMATAVSNSESPANVSSMPRTGRSDTGVWCQRWGGGLFIKLDRQSSTKLESFRRRKLSSLQYSRKSVQALFPKASRPSGNKELRSDGNGVPLILQRVWPSSGWRIARGMSAWVYAIDPFHDNEFSDPQGETVSEISDELSDVLGLWFSSKAAVLHARRWLKRQPATQGSMPAIYRHTVVWPVTPLEFSGFLDDFVPGRSFPLDDGKLDCVKAANGLQDIADSICSVRPSCQEPGCINCPGIGGCPQLEGDNKTIRALSALHLWISPFFSHFAIADSAEGQELRNKALEGLDLAVSCLDGISVRPLDFSHQAAKHNNTTAGAYAPNPSDEEHERRRYERKLLRFWLARAIDESLKRLRADWEQHPLQRQLLEYPAALGRLATVLLADQPWTAERIETLIQALAGYAHQILGVPDRLDLGVHLRQTLRGETALHTLKQRYRDHFFHTIEVCLIGHWMLLSHPDAATPATLADVLVAKCTAAKAEASAAASNRVEEAARWHVPEDARKFLANWWLAALTHDTAYGIDILGGTLRLLDYFKNHDAIGHFTKAVNASVKELSQQLCGVVPDIEGLKDDTGIAKGDHGLITAGHLDHSLAKIGTKDQIDYRPAVRAIAFHNTRHPKVDALRDPVAALLILCDTVQNWGRSQLGFTRSPAEVLSRIVEGGGSPNEEQFGPVEQFYFSMQPVPTGSTGTANSPRVHVWSEKNKLEIRLHYAPWTTRSPDRRQNVLFDWADMTYNLQRVDFSGWELELEIVERTPYAEPWKQTDQRLKPEDQKARELERFAAMVEEQSAAFLKPWLDAIREKKTGTAGAHGSALLYEAFPPPDDKDCGWEEVTFRLREMGEAFKSGRPLMGGRADMFGDVIKDWSKGSVASKEHLMEQRSPR